MTHTIQNEKLRVKINAIGAELSSIVRKSDTKELLWQGDPEFWTGQAPVLFPNIGKLKDDEYLYKDTTYSLAKHGFIRHHKNLEAHQNCDSKIAFSLASSPATRAIYPFDFLFEIEFELLDDTLKVTHHVHNKGNEELYFAIGGHPAFNCPLEPSEQYTDYRISIPNAANPPSYVLDPEGLISTDTIAVFDGDTIDLKPDLFDNDALIFKNIKGKQAILAHKTKGPVLAMNYADFSDLGIWAKPKAPYVCIEPWLGYADLSSTNKQLQDKEGTRKLSAKATHSCAYEIVVY